MDTNKEYEQKILGNHEGCGTIFTGKYHHLDYQPSRKSEYSLECNGVMLLIRRNSDQNAHDFYGKYVLFKTPSGFLAKLFLAPSDFLPFRDRLKIAIDDKIDEIKKDEIRRQALIENRRQALIEKAEKIVKCQLKIDKTVSGVAGVPVKPYSNSKLEPLTELERQNAANQLMLKEKNDE